MREIKFRAWDKEYKYMNYKVLVGNVWDTDTKYTAHAMWIEPKYVSYKKESGWCHFDEHSNIELMQYTGLKDKNNVEIFEGDIIRVNKLTYDKNNEFEPFVSKIEFYMGSFHLDTKKMLLLSYGKDIEVIGNIYENKELLV